MRYTIDRIEGEYAVCETEAKNHIAISLEKLPDSVKEGDVIVSKGEVYEIDHGETQARRRRIREKMRNLFE